MRIQIRCASGLWLEFEGDLGELEAFDAFLSTLALVERRALEAPAASDEPAKPEPVIEAAPEPEPEPQPEEIAAEPEPEPEPRARPTDKADAVVAAVGELGECTARDVARHLGRPDEYVAIGQMLKKLRKQGLVGHNGQQTKRARYLSLAAAAGDTAADIPEAEIAEPPAPADDPPAPVDDTAPPAAPIAVLPPPAEPAPEPLTDLEQRIVELVHRHGPVTALWIADQVLKHRRDVGVMMRDLEGRGVLADSGGGWYSLPGAEEAQAA